MSRRQLTREVLTGWYDEQVRFWNYVSQMQDMALDAGEFAAAKRLALRRNSLERAFGRVQRSLERLTSTRTPGEQR